MFSDIVAFAFAVIGIVSVFYSVIFRLTAMLTEKLTIVIPLHYNDESIHDRIRRIRSLLDFCHMKKKCTIVIENHGASDDYCNELKDCYSQYNEIIIKELRT